MAEQIASLFVAIGANLAGLTEGLSQAQSKLKTVGDRMGSIGRGLTAAVTLPLIGIGVASVKMAADFEQQMALAQLSLRDTGVSMETVSDYALKMGADTIFNAQEMALALTGLGKAGLDRRDSRGHEWCHGGSCGSHESGGGIGPGLSRSSGYRDRSNGYLQSPRPRCHSNSR